MANPILAQLTAAVARDTEVDSSAIVLINGFAARTAAAVDAAIANGATAEQLVPITTEIATWTANSDALAAAVAANTGAQPTS